MRWKLLSFALLLVVFLQCGDDSMNGNADPIGEPAATEIFEFRTPEELREFRFPTDVKGATGFRLTKIEKQLESFRVVPIFTEDGGHSLDDGFINTELIRIIVWR